jgi:uncharacterized Fe-S cluster-containing radical SAM superfamily enzyme
MRDKHFYPQEGEILIDDLGLEYGKIMGLKLYGVQSVNELIDLIRTRGVNFLLTLVEMDQQNVDELLKRLRELGYSFDIK